MGTIKQALTMIEDLDEVLGAGWVQNTENDFARGFLTSDLHAIYVHVIPDPEDIGSLGYEVIVTELATGDGIVVAKASLEDVIEVLRSNKAPLYFEGEDNHV